MNYIIPYFMSFAIGYLSLCLLLKQKKIDFYIHIFLSMGLGLGLSSQIVFYSFVIFDQLNKSFVIGLHAALLVFLLILNCYYFRSQRFNFLSVDTADSISSPILAIVFITLAPLLFYAKFYPYGGWDAWSVWNLKARFLFAGAQQWRNVFDPLLWYSSPHYPLLLPCMNVWGWTFMHQTDNIIPLATSVVFTILTAGLLFSGLKTYIKTLPAALAALLILTLEFFIQLGTSQYGDIVFAFFLLSAIFCLIMLKDNGQTPFAFISGLCLGFLSFTKSEGMAAALILAILGSFYIWWPPRERLLRKKQLTLFLVGVIIASLPSLIFQIFYAPSNQVFINGLTSLSNPITFKRLKTIFGFLGFTLISSKWNGLWVAFLVGLLLSKRKCVSKRIWFIPSFFLFYGGTVFCFYLINTYFEIAWWLSTTLNRVLFAILPTALFWMFYSLFRDERKETP